VNQYQQPDEQIEFAGPTAIAIRGNFDFETDRVNGNGRETSLESAYFPVVTTANDEIVIYALRSVSGPNPNSLTFYADTRLNGGGAGRDAYPGGYAEETVTVTNLDLGTADTTSAGCTTANYPCYRFNNPPYTLYRFTLSPTGTVVETPLASNIRSLNFQYYTNVTGTTVTPEPTYAGGWVSQVRLSDPGGGQYNPVTPDASRVPRLARTLIKSLRVTLVGMAEAPEGGYDNPFEPATSPANRYRTYRLESLIVPRNLGKAGVREIPPSPPGAPSIQSITYGYCGVVRLDWLAPSASTATGPVESYMVQYNTANDGTFPYIWDAGSSTYTYVPGLTPGDTYYFTVVAMNSYGNQVALTAANATQVISITPQNRTSPGPPSGLVATGGSGGAARANQIVLTWQAPTTNISPNDRIYTQSITGTTTNAQQPPVPDEFRTYKVYRSTTPNFTPVDAGNPGANEVSAAAPNSLTLSGTTATFVDKTILTCVTYYYRVRAIERCGQTGCSSCNVGTAVGVSEPFPAVGTNGATGVATAAAAPSAPTALVALPGSECSGSNCDIDLEWPKVKTDIATPPNTIYVQRYILTRTRYVGATIDPDNGPPSGPAVVRIVVNDSSPATGTVMTYNDNPPARSGSIDYTYRYTVRAEQCPDTTVTPTSYMASAESPALWFPCSFAGSGLSVSVTFTLEGDGETPASAWLTNNPDSNVVVNGTGIVSAQAFLKTGSLVIDLGTRTGAPPFAFPLVEAEVGELYELTVVARDATGCASTITRYIEEGTATGCCLAAFANDATVVRYAPGQSYVDIAFKNLCQQNLEISSVELRWDPVIAGNATATTLTNIEFPSTGTGTAVRVLTDTASAGSTSIRTITTSPPTSASPPARTTVSAASENYVIRVNFNKILTNSSSPITSFCVIYTRAGIDVSNQNCRIVPQPTTLFSCN
ncbi:MAG TPA: fibronectin type III domain-containing protein, partial [Thermoanaerobaculia bacterium]|nr:fibronectin type III domain-containing protein [Thermoanaerobaculia bacterium]